MKAVSAPEQVIAAARQSGNKRSAEYWRGALDALRFRMLGDPIRCPYREGSVEFDAYFAGNERGHHLWRDLQSGELALGRTSGAAS